MKILVTGGLGFIGSHTVVELLEDNYEVVVVDDLSNSSPDVVDKIKEITGKDFKFYEADVCDLDALEKIFTVSVAIVTIDVKMLDELDRFIENLIAEGSSIENGLENSVENSPLKSVIFDKYSGFALTKNVFVEEVLARMLKASSDGCYVSIAGVNDDVVDKLLSLISKGASRNEFMNWLSNFETKSVDNVDCYCVDFVFCDNHSVLTIEQYVFAVDDGRLVDVLPVNS